MPAAHGSYQYTIAHSREANARLMYHLSTSKGQNLTERLGPGDIARGKGDGFLVGLARDIAATGQPAYLRLMGEMNNCNNAYAAYDSGGGKRDRAHSAATFKRAWKRVHLIMHGGDVAAIDARLQRMRLPAVQVGAASCPRPRSRSCGRR